MLAGGAAPLSPETTRGDSHRRRLPVPHLVRRRLRLGQDGSARRRAHARFLAPLPRCRGAADPGVHAAARIHVPPVPVLLLLLVLLALLSLVAHRFVARLRVGSSVDPAETLLRERLTRSEISAEEYESPLDGLRSSQAQRLSLEARNGNSLRRTYEDYVREAMIRLRPGRNAGT
jgi:hypothetical protein